MWCLLYTFMAFLTHTTDYYSPVAAHASCAPAAVTLSLAPPHFEWSHAC